MRARKNVEAIVRTIDQVVQEGRETINEAMHMQLVQQIRHDEFLNTVNI